MPVINILLKCGGMFNNRVIANFLQNVSVKIVKIGQYLRRYGHIFDGMFLTHCVYDFLFYIHCDGDSIFCIFGNVTF